MSAGIGKARFAVLPIGLLGVILLFVPTSRRLLSQTAAGTKVVPKVSPGDTAPLRGYRTPYTDAIVIDSPLRAARNGIYDGWSEEAPLSSSSKPRVLAYPQDVEHNELIPLDVASEVAVGTAVSGRSYLSSDKTTVYTELQVKVAQVLENKSTRAVTVGSTIAVVRGGGVVDFGSGQVLVRGAPGESVPRRRSPCLLLLQYVPAADAYQLITGFELNSAGVYELDVPHQSGNQASLAVYPGTAADFVQMVSSALGTLRTAGN